MTTVTTFKPTVQIIDEQGVKTPCIARTYKNGQWRQCNITLNMLLPLLNVNREQILDKDGNTIYIAKREF